MRKALRIIGLIALVFLGILIILFAYLEIKYPPEKIQTVILEQVHKRIHRRVVATSLQIHPLSGFELHHFVVYDTTRSPERPFLTVKSVKFNYRLWSIFRKKIEIKKIEIDSPRLFLRRNREGFWNFNDLISPLSDSLTESASPSAEPELPGIVKGISFHVREFSVRDAGIEA